MYPQPSIQTVTNHQLAIKSIWAKHKSSVSYREWIQNVLHFEIEFHLQQLLRSFCISYKARVDGTRSHTNQHIGLAHCVLCQIKDAYIIACGKIDIQNRVNVTVLHRFNFLLHQSMAIFQFRYWNRSTSCQQFEAIPSRAYAAHGNTCN